MPKKTTIYCTTLVHSTRVVSDKYFASEIFAYYIVLVHSTNTVSDKYFAFKITPVLHSKQVRRKFYTSEV